MKFFAVIDTNVLVSSMLKGTTIPGIIVDKAINGPIVPLLNNEILEEYEEVLLRNKFGFEEEDVRTLINELRKRAIYLDRTMVDEVFEDPDDVVFYEIVMTARTAVDAYLITGNKKHFPFKSYVVTPRGMLEIIGEE